MAADDPISPQEHKALVARYVAEKPHYDTYSEALQRVLKDACRVTLPEAQVQSRAKSVSSFAEKVVRKWKKYKDPVRQLTDLCGARVIVQTAEQVRAVRNFIEANFDIVEADDKVLMLDADKFGYRDMHYIVRLRRGDHLAIEPKERHAIGERKAEIQVRTWLQHAWADTLHDRIYKNKLRISPRIVRTGHLLAALMEEGDRVFDSLAEELDGMIVNYAAFAPRAEVLEEIDIQRLILKNETEDRKKPALALALARLYAATGAHAEVERTLTPHVGTDDPNAGEILLLLGAAVCRLHAAAPDSAGYRAGIDWIARAVQLCEAAEVDSVPNLRRRRGLHARALWTLARALEKLPGGRARARQCYYAADELEPSNPYYLADMLGLELRITHAQALPDTMRAVIRQALKTCAEHAQSGIELPWAYFTAARLSLFLGDGDEGLGSYARAIRHCRNPLVSVPADALASEIEWLRTLHDGVEVPAAWRRAAQLLELGNSLAAAAPPKKGGPTMKRPILVLGGRDGEPKSPDKVRHMLEEAVASFSGTVICAGTTGGVSGCIGDIARELKRARRKRFDLIGFAPPQLPLGTAVHPEYDKVRQIENDFWSDMVSLGVSPEEVSVLGFGGGPLSAEEYRIAAGLGAAVGLVETSGGATDALLGNPSWSELRNVYPLPFDCATVRAFVVPGNESEAQAREKMAQGLHRQYLKSSAGRLPENLRPWETLPETYRRANLEQARYSVEILRAAGFLVSESAGEPPFAGFTVPEVDKMAELEHGRWNVERLRANWRYSRRRDNERKLHNCLIPWKDLPEEIKEFDRKAVRAFPALLAEAGLRISRRKGKAEVTHA